MYVCVYVCTYVCLFVVVCQLESSGKWPEALEAIEKIKTAFYVHMSSALREQKGLVTSPTQNYLDILKVLRKKKLSKGFKGRVKHSHPPHPRSR